MKIEAAIFDLDGVISDTATLHFVVWKKMFDEFLPEYEKDKFQEFTQEDYQRYVDGIPRLDGVRSFLKSRGIEISEGQADDEEDVNTVNGLALRKNRQFVKTLEQQGGKIFDSSINLIKEIKAAGIKVGIISSSKNCKKILERGNVESLFETRVDGFTLDELGLNGKPAPDIFLEAAQRLNVDPKKSLVVEDALLGVRAAKAGNFGLVVGIDRHNSIREELKENGANIVVTDLSELCLDDLKRWFIEGTPSYVFDKMDNIKQSLESKRIAVFLDYDGTLTPIVEKPELATLSAEMRDTLRRVSDTFTTAIISGRQLADVKKLVDIDSLYYVGNHGLEIEGPSSEKIEGGAEATYEQFIDETYQELTKKIGDIDGLLLEHKGFTLSVHYRLVNETTVPRIEFAIDEILQKFPKLQKRYGKKVFEIRPQVNWDKGKVVLHLLKLLNLDKENVMPIYIGDDITDNDAFRAIKGKGLSLLVTEKSKLSVADYLLKDPEEVRVFLEGLLT